MFFQLKKKVQYFRGPGGKSLNSTAAAGPALRWGTEEANEARVVRETASKDASWWFTLW